MASNEKHTLNDLAKLEGDPDDVPCDFCYERMGDHTETMRWRCERGE